MSCPCQNKISYNDSPTLGVSCRKCNENKPCQCKKTPQVCDPCNGFIIIEEPEHQIRPEELFNKIVFDRVANMMYIYDAYGSVETIDLDYLGIAQKVMEEKAQIAELEKQLAEKINQLRHERDVRDQAQDDVINSKFDTSKVYTKEYIDGLKENFDGEISKLKAEIAKYATRVNGNTEDANDNIDVVEFVED